MDDGVLIKLGNFLENYINAQRRTLNVDFNIQDNPNNGDEGKANRNVGQ